VDAGEIIVTTGATEALNLCLQAAAPAGSAIAVESPTYYALLQAIERMGMPVEIDTDPVQGINLEALERAIVEKAWRPAWSCPISRTRWASR
jgi:DNA-binding transcriptional MocR family regulator